MKETNESRLLTTGVTRRKLVQTTLVGGLAMATGAFRTVLPYRTSRSIRTQPHLSQRR